MWKLELALGIIQEIMNEETKSADHQLPLALTWKCCIFWHVLTTQQVNHCFTGTLLHCSDQDSLCGSYETYSLALREDKDCTV